MSNPSLESDFRPLEFLLQLHKLKIDSLIEAKLPCELGHPKVDSLQAEMRRLVYIAAAHAFASHEWAPEAFLEFYPEYETIFKHARIEMEIEKWVSSLFEESGPNEVTVYCRFGHDLENVDRDQLQHARCSTCHRLMTPQDKGMYFHSIMHAARVGR
jgi:hypothetical protein